jgi:hypothetical protein
MVELENPLKVLDVSEDYRTIQIGYDEMEFTFHVNSDGKSMFRSSYKNYGTHIYVKPPWSIENQCRQRAWIVFKENEKREKELTPQKIEENFKECVSFFEEKRRETQLQFQFSHAS